MAKVDFQFWKAPGAAYPLSASVSALAHVVLVGAWVTATLPGMASPRKEPNQKVWYFPPPNPKPSAASSVESIRYVALAPEGPGAGAGPVGEGAGVELDVGRRASRSVGDLGRDSLSAPEQERQSGSTDSVFTIIEVDTAAARLPESAAPRYPIALLEKRVQGQAVVRFVVDTTGRADTTSFDVVVASHIEFALSVREALPGMRFSTARIGSVKVRQLVELPFTFTIALPPPDTIAPARTSARRPK